MVPDTSWNPAFVWVCGNCGRMVQNQQDLNERLICVNCNTEMDTFSEALRSSTSSKPLDFEPEPMGYWEAIKDFFHYIFGKD